LPRRPRRQATILCLDYSSLGSGTVTSDINAQLLDEWQIENAEASIRVASDYPDERILALEDIDAEAGALVMLDDMLVGDPDATVRLAALEKLDESDSTIAHESILKAFDDPDSEVILTALAIIDQWDDDEVIARYVAPLASHPDIEISDYAAKIIDENTISTKSIPLPPGWGSGINSQFQ
jgi:hypothetical protein